MVKLVDIFRDGRKYAQILDFLMDQDMDMWFTSNAIYSGCKFEYQKDWQFPIGSKLSRLVFYGLVERKGDTYRLAWKNLQTVSLLNMMIEINKK